MRVEYVEYCKIKGFATDGSGDRHKRITTGTVDFPDLDAKYDTHKSIAKDRINKNLPADNFAVITKAT